jgi:CubicO group peptidase (beta-lactamase class C family)
MDHAKTRCNLIGYRSDTSASPGVKFTISVLLSVSLAMANAALAGVIPAGSPSDVGVDAARLARIHEVVERHIGAGDVAGVVTLVARRGRVVHFESQGYANIETRESLQTDSIFRLASMSKPITAVAIMMLVEQGRIQLGDPVSRYIPEFAALKHVAVAKADGSEGYDLISAQRPITVRDLLTHGSGLVSGGLGARASNDLAPRTERDSLRTYIPKLASVPLDFQPGSLWRYSGLAGFDVLSRIVEVASGQTFDDYLHEQIFTPLEMSSTAFNFTAEAASRVATMHRRAEHGLETIERPLSRVYFSGAGGLASSAEDYLQFAQMLLNGGELNGHRFLSPRTVALMTTNHTGDMVNGQFGRPARGMGFGLSMQIVEDAALAGLAVSKGAYGWAGGTGVSFWIEPAEQMVTIFMIQGGSAGRLRAGFETAVRQAIVD